MVTQSVLIVLRWTFIVFAVYLAFLAFLFAVQDSLIFFPREMTEEQWKEIAEGFKADYVTIRADAEGHHLQGWFLSDHAEEPRPTLILFGGNAMNMHDVVPFFFPLTRHGINVLLVDYRGYGLNEGKPHGETMKKDAEKIFDAALAHPYVDNDRIIAFGISIGTGVATHLASVREVDRVILMSPFTNTVDLGFETIPFVPKPLIRPLLRHKLDNLSLAPHLEQPALIIQGKKDRQLSPRHAEIIAEAWGGPVELLMVPRRGHNDLLLDREMWKKVVEFVKAGKR